MTFNFAVPRSKFNEKKQRIRPCTRHGTSNRRIIVENIEKVIVNGPLGRPVEVEIERTYHATKGWRSVRLPGFRVI